MRALALLILLIPTLLFAGQVKLHWDANTESNLAGYKIYKSRTGQRPYQYAGTVYAPTTTVTLDNISTSISNVFAVTAFDNLSTESSYSNRVHVSVPTTKQRAKINGNLRGGF